MGIFNPVPLLTNPRWTTDFIIRRSTITIDNDGITSKTNVDIAAEGVIVPGQPAGAITLAEVDRQDNEITIYSLTKIIQGDASLNQSPDDIVYDDRLWKVSEVKNYGEWNFWEARATLADPGGRPII